MKFFILLQIVTFILTITVSDKVRRKDRQITDKAMIEKFLTEQSIIRIGYYDKGNDEVYIVPLNYGYIVENDQYIFYMHGGKKGRKFELTKDGPKVGFEIDGHYELMRDDVACKHTAKYQSIIGNGKIELINNIEDKKKAISIIMEHATGKTGFEYNQKMLEALGIYKLTATKLTCKGNL